MTCLWLGATAYADEPVDPFEESDAAALFAMEEALVTVASRYAQTTREAPAIVTVITAEQIRARGYRTLAELLRGLPGITVTRSKEGRTLAWFRGAIAPDNSKFLLLVDGVPWYDGVYQHAWIDAYLPLSIVKQVEVIKGPGSAIYGTNAFAGVVHVVTWQADDIEGGYGRAEGGSAYTVGATVMAGGRGAAGDDPVRAWSYGRVYDTLGDGLDLTPKGETNVHGANPVRAVNAGARVSWRGLSVRYDHVDYRHSYLTKPQGTLWEVWGESADEAYLAYRNEFLAARWDVRLGRNLTLAPHAFFQEYDNPGVYGWLSDPQTTVTTDTGGTTTASTELVSTLVDAEKHTLRYGVGLDLEARPAPSHLTVAGLGFEGVRILTLEDKVYEDPAPETDPDPSFYTPPGTDAHGVYAYAQHTWTALYWLELTAGLRGDYNLFGDWPFASPRLGVLLVPTSSTWVKLLYGRALRAPSARESLVQETGLDEDGLPVYTASNPDLVPEEINTVEAEVTWAWRGLTLRGATFYSRLTRIIDAGRGNNTYQNLDTLVTVAGTEAEATWSSDRLDAGLSWAWTWGRDQGLSIYGVPSHALHARATWQAVDGLYLSGNVDAFSRRHREEWAPGSGAEDGPAYALVDLSVATDRLAKGHVRLDASVHNVLNTEYEDLVYLDDANAVKNDERKYPNDIEGEGRLFMVGLEVEF